MNIKNLNFIMLIVIITFVLYLGLCSSPKKNLSILEEPFTNQSIQVKIEKANKSIIKYTDKINLLKKNNRILLKVDDKEYTTHIKKAQNNIKILENKIKNLEKFIKSQKNINKLEKKIKKLEKKIKSNSNAPKTMENPNDLTIITSLVNKSYKLTCEGSGIVGCDCRSKMMTSAQMADCENALNISETNLVTTYINSNIPPNYLKDYTFNTYLQNELITKMPKLFNFKSPYILSLETLITPKMTLQDMLPPIIQSIAPRLIQTLGPIITAK